MVSIVKSIDPKINTDESNVQTYKLWGERNVLSPIMYGSSVSKERQINIPTFTFRFFQKQSTTIN